MHFLNSDMSKTKCTSLNSDMSKSVSNWLLVRVVQGIYTVFSETGIVKDFCIYCPFVKFDDIQQTSTDQSYI